MDELLREYATPGPFTRLRPDQAGLADGLPDDPVAVCVAVQSLVVEPDDAVAAGVPGPRAAERNLRSAAEIVETLTSLDPSALHVPRPPQLRVVGTCRHFALLSCALLRHRGVPARARCGFATYFVPDRYVDHWVVEYWQPGERRWVRVDPEVLDQPVVSRADDLAPTEFYTGGEAWRHHRAGADPDLFGVAGVDHAWGVGEIRGNAIRDLAALCRHETLPWDEWGRMTASYRGETDAAYDTLVDRIATTTATNDLEAIHTLYASEDLTVPTHLLPTTTQEV